MEHDKHIEAMVEVFHRSCLYEQEHDPRAGKLRRQLLDGGYIIVESTTHYDLLRLSNGEVITSHLRPGLPDDWLDP
jgi:hypothetical protein